MRKGETHTVPKVMDKTTLLLLHGDAIEDSSGYRHLLTNNGVVVALEKSKFGGSSMYFNGSSYLQAPCLLTGNTPFTIDFWAYPTALRNNAVWSHGGTNLLAGTGGGLELYGDGKVIYYSQGFWIRDGSYALNTWQHIALVSDGSSMKLFVNGTLVGTHSGDYNFANYVETIGANASAFGQEDFQGYIDELRISNVARWTTDFTPPTEPY